MDKDFETFFKSFDIELPEMGKTQCQTKQLILNSVQDKEPIRKQAGFALKDFERKIMSRRNIFKPTVLVVLATMLIAVIGVLQFSNSRPASALEITKKGIEKLQTISDAEFVELSTVFAGDPKDALNEAKKSKDLKSITRKEYDQLTSEYNLVVTQNQDTVLPDGTKQTSGSVTVRGNESTSDTIGTVSEELMSGSGTVDNGTLENVTSGTLVSGSEGKTLSPQEADEFIKKAQQPLNDSVKFVRYTNSSKQLVVIGFDKDGVPQFKSIFTNN